MKFIRDLTVKQHVIKRCQTAYCELKRITASAGNLTEEATKQQVSVCVWSRLDYCKIQTHKRFKITLFIRTKHM